MTSKWVFKLFFEAGGVNKSNISMKVGTQQITKQYYAIDEQGHRRKLRPRVC